MLLKEKCHVCGKEIKGIQSQFVSGKHLHTIYSCGHLKLQNIDSFPLHEIKPQNGNVSNVSNVSEPKPIEERDFKCDPPTKEELYDNLDRWVSEGGAYKKSPEELAAEEYWRSFNTDPIWKSLDGKKKTFAFQYQGVRFAEQTQLKCLIGDACGLGKTIQALMVLKLHRKIVSPALILVRGSTVFQWAKEYKEWCSDDFSGVMPVIGRINIMPGFHTYIMSQDLLTKKDVREQVKKLGIRCVVIDEVQYYKDSDAERTKALIDLIQTLKIPYRIAMSGTAIKNRLSEYFTILNLLDPINFPSRLQFQRYWLETNDKGQYTKLKSWREEEFKKLTSKYIIRREKNEVLKDLPPLQRDYQIVEIDDPGLKKSYNHEVGLFQSFLKNEAKIDSQQILGWLARLRKITAQAKVPLGVEWAEEFLKSSDESLCIGVHHEDVRETLQFVFKTKGYDPLSLSGKDNIYQKDRIKNDFNSGKNRLLNLSMLAGGVGLNLQSCANALVLERQWNSADEEQFESRFHRNGQTKGVMITYLIAKGTIDEFFHDMVYEKRNILASAGIGNPDEETNSISFLKEFAEFVASRRI